MEEKIILIIDDNKELCKTVKRGLEVLGDFKVAAAFDGNEGIKLAKRYKPHLILLDIQMPKMDGFEVLKALKGNDATIAIPVVMLTANADDVSKIIASQMYDEDYITKPVDLNELNTRVENVLKRRGVY